MTDTALHDLPDEFVEAMKAPRELTKKQLEALGLSLAAMRQESVLARKESGIEEIWAAAEDAYAGIDDANRGEVGGHKWAKPTGLTGPLTTNDTRTRGEVRSTVFVRLSSRYVDCGAAKVGEILLPVDDKAFSFEPTPVPDLIAGLNDNRQVMINGVPAERDPRPGELPVQPGAPAAQGGAPAALPAAPVAAAPGSPPPGVPLTYRDLAQEAIDKANASAKAAETRIYDWMVEAQYPAEMRKVIFDAARIGVGVLKGPFPKKRVARAAKKDPATGRVTLDLKVEIVPSYEWRDPWNIFPHRACGENVQNGDNFFDRDFYSRKQLRALKGTPGYIDAAIDKVLGEDPQASSSLEADNPNREKNRHRYEVWFYYGMVSRADLLAAGSIRPEDQTKDEVYAICTLVNDTVIHAVLNPLESGEFPYHAVPWQRRAGFWAGVGICEQVSTPQRIINAATRAMLNNAGKSAGSVTVVDKGSVIPADGKWELTPDKLFYKAADSTIDDVRKAFAFFQVPNTTDALMKIIQYALRLAEESTSIPLVTQGQSGPTQPETLGATQLQNNNANQLLRSIGYAFDDYITEPVVRQSYEMLLLDDTVPDEEKGDWHINAHGSTAFVERAIQDQTIAQMAAFVKDPAYGTDPKRWFAEFMRTKHLNPVVFQYTKEEQAKIDAQPKPKAPAIEVAMIRSADVEKKLQADAAAAAAASQAAIEAAHVTVEGRLQAAEIKAGVDEKRIAADTDRDTVYVQAERERTIAEGQAKREELQLRERLAILEYANKKDMKLADVQKQLADTSMRLRVQKELAGVAHVADAVTRERDRAHERTVQARDHAVELHSGGESIKPAAEPPGKAPAGQAFTK